MPTANRTVKCVSAVTEKSSHQIDDGVEVMVLVQVVVTHANLQACRVWQGQQLVRAKLMDRPQSLVLRPVQHPDPIGAAMQAALAVAASTASSAG